MAKPKKITPADRMAQELLRLRRELDTILSEYLSAVQTPEDGGPVRLVVDPLRKLTGDTWAST
jgi:hypothetical protein